jgi:alcohol dehydrogenase class IV
VKVEDSDLPRLAKNCMLDDWTYSNPRPIKGPDEIMQILRAAY